MINILSSKFTWGKTILLLKQDRVGRSTGENDSGQILKQIEWYKLAKYYSWQVYKVWEW